MIYIVAQYVIGLIVGVVLMRKFDDRKVFGFHYGIALLLLIALTILIRMSTSSLQINEYLLIAYGPFFFSYVSGYVYFLIKGTY